MSSPGTAPPSASTGGGGAGRGPGRGQGRRRARNRRHRRNRMQRSLHHVVGWNAEGLRTKVPELQSWLPTVRADVVAIQEAQFSAKTATRIPGYQPPVYARRERGRISGAASAKGGDVAIFVRAGIHFAPLTERLTDPADDSTEVCGVRILGTHPINIINVYRPPIRRSPEDQREDRFDPGAVPSGEDTIVLGTSTPTTPSGTAVATQRTTSGSDWPTGWTVRTGSR